MSSIPLRIQALEARTQTATTQIVNIQNGTATNQSFASLLAQPSSTLAVDLSKGTSIYVGVDTSGTIAKATNQPAAGISVTFMLQQKGAGYFSPSWHSSWGVPVRFLPRQGPGQISSISFVSNGDGTFSPQWFDGIDLGGPLNVLDYGCPVDGVTDCSTALQAALDTGKHLYFPAIPVYNRYICNSPLWQKHAGQNLVGDQSCPALQGPSSVGPTLVLCPAYLSTPSLPLVTALLTGPGSAAHFDGTGNYWLGFSENFNMTLNGLGAFAIEFAVSFDSIPSSGNSLLSCAGARESYFQVFTIGTTGLPSGGHDTLSVSCQIGSSLVSLTSGSTTVVASTTYKIAVTYDGSTLRLFINGTLANSVAATGNVNQPNYCDWVLGAFQQYMFEGGARGNTTACAVDGLRISKTARYTANYTASGAKPGWDSNTLLLHNFDNESGQFSRCSTTDGSGNAQTQWIMLRRVDQSGVSGGLIKNLSFVDGLGFKTGIWANCFNNVTMDNVKSTAKVTIFANSINWWIKNSTISVGGINERWSLGLGRSVNAVILTNCVITSGIYQVVGCEAAGYEFKGMLMQPTGNTSACFVFVGDGNVSEDSQVSLSDVECDVETAVLGVWEAPVVLAGLHSFRISGGIIESPFIASPLVKMNNCGTGTMEGVFLKVQGSTQEIVNSDGTQWGFVYLNGCHRTPGNPPWSNSPIYVADGVAKPQSQTAAFTATAYPGANLCDATTAAYIATLPAANSVDPGTELVFKKTDSSAHAVTVTAAGADKIDGSATFALSTQYKFLRIASDGSANWEVLGSN